MAEILSFREFRFPDHKRVNSQFIPSRLKENTELATEDLAKSGLTPEDIDALIIGDAALPSEALAGYIIPYTTPDGAWCTGEGPDLAMYRIKLKYPANSTSSQKYTQPSKEELEQYNIPSIPPYIPKSYHTDPKTSTLVICEGEKKTAAVHKFTGLSAIGIGGCHAWRFGNHVHPWILELCRNHKEILLIPDADLFRYDICKAYGTFAGELIRELEATGINVEILRPEDKIDDLLVQWGPESEALFSDIERVRPQDLVEDPSRLAIKYDLAFRQGSRGEAIVEQHSSNITRLIVAHPAFPDIWRDQDTNKVMIGDRELIPEVTDMEIANHMQHHFALGKVKHHMVRDVLKALADRNSRSPFLEWVESEVWDGVPRLDTWMQRLWGVPDNEYIQQVGSRWLIGAVARLRRPGCKFDWMWITTGPQGIGKSSVANVLFRGHIVSMYGHANDKDIKMLLHDGLCIVVDEMDSLSKSEVTFWKSMLSTTEDKFRPPYGASVRAFQRRSVMYGTTNSEAFLQADSTGYRRYMPVKVSQMLDFAGLKEELSQLWAEAAHRHANGEAYWEVSADNGLKEEFVVENPMEARVHDYIRMVCTKDNKIHMTEVRGQIVWEFTLSDVMLELGLPPESPVRAREIKNILLSVGAEAVTKMRIKNGRGFRMPEDIVKGLRG